MRYDIGEYGLTRDKIFCWASLNGEPIHYLWYVWDSSEELNLATYEESVEVIKAKMSGNKIKAVIGKDIETGKEIDTQVESTPCAGDDEQQDDYYQGCDRSDISKLCKFVNFFHLLFLPGNA